VLRGLKRRAKTVERKPKALRKGPDYGGDETGGRVYGSLAASTQNVVYAQEKEQKKNTRASLEEGMRDGPS